MDIGTLIGVIGGIVLVVTAIALKASILNFIDIPSILIVFGGTIAATLNSFPLANMLQAVKTSIIIFFAHRIDYIATIKEMFIISVTARKKGVLELEKYKTNDRFLKKGLTLVADGTKGPILRQILQLECDTMEERHNEIQLILEKMGELAPAWGMIGTLIGLVIMLLNLNDPSAIGPAMAVALLTTFYGALWANFILLPAANKLEGRSKNEIRKYNLITESLASIADSENPTILRERLLGLLPPKERQKAIPRVAPKAKVQKKKGS